MAQHKAFLKIALLGIFILVVCTSCGDVLMGQGPDGTPTYVPYDVWLAYRQATDSVETQWAYYGTPTFTPSPTITPTPTTTATMTPSPTITPSPTPTPFTGYWVVDNKAGEVIALAEFQPECSGEWGYPGMDIWRVENGEPVSKVCGTPWNRPQNMAVKVILGILGFLVTFLVILIASNEWRKYKLAKRRKTMQQPRLPATAAIRKPSSDEVGQMIRQLAVHDRPLAVRLFEFRRQHHQELIETRGYTIKAFAAFVQKKDNELYLATQAALEKVAK